ncbi:MAG: PilN domain-containing protein [Candidatus Binatia bacterium]|nr:PilN domain-containing protein [Candidatus Binatia bacterium]
MIRINLLPVREAERALGRRRQISLAILTTIVVLLAMALPYTLQGRRLAELEENIAKLQQEIARLDQQAKEVKDLDAKRAELQAKLQVIEQLKRRRVGPVRALEDLSDATPEKLWLTEFTESGGVVSIQGLAIDNQTIAEFMRRLQQSNYFYEVDLVETAQAVTQPGAPAGPSLKRFQIKALLDYVGRRGKNGAPSPAEQKKPA